MMHDRYLCRGKRMDGSAWVQGYYVPAGDIATIVRPTRMGFHAERPEGSADAWMVDPATIGQCTDLRDKNGTLIFEGDIVKWGHMAGSRENPHRIAEVKLCPDIQYHSQIGVFAHGAFMYARCTEEALEVIGTIHDTPALLEPTP